jgi:hypothetical protein
MRDRVLLRARHRAPGLTVNEGVGLAFERFLNRRDNLSNISMKSRLHLFKIRRPLSRQEAQLESPPWDKEALRETAARYDAGKEQPIDWDAAKRELRKRAQ